MARMTQAQIEQWISQNGGPGTVQYAVEQKPIKNPAYDPYDDSKGPQYTTIEVETWKNSRTGAVLSAKRGDAGDFDVVENTGADPNKRDPNTPTPRTPEQQRSDAANATKAEQDAAEAQRVKNESEWNANPANVKDGASGRYETHAVRDARLAKEKQDADTKARQAGIDEQAAETRAQNATTAASQEARRVEESNRPDTKVEKRELGGQVYLISTTVPKDGSAPTTRYYGPDGAQVPRLPSEGEATVGGPKMPRFVASAAAQSLTDYHTGLANDPTLTPAQREKHFQEAVQIANTAVQEASTQQRERESQRNTDYNVSTYKTKYLQDGVKDALEYASKLKGTDLGGKVFAAMLGLQLATLQASGIDNLTGKAAPTITTADMRSTAAIDAKRAEIDQHAAEIMAHPAFRPAPPVTATDPMAAQPAAPAAPAPAVAPRVGAAPGPASPVAGSNPDAGQALGPTGDSPPLGQGASTPPAEAPASPDVYGPGQAPGGRALPSPVETAPPASPEPGYTLPYEAGPPIPSAEPQLRIQETWPIRNSSPIRMTQSQWDAQSDEYKRNHQVLGNPGSPAGGDVQKMLPSDNSAAPWQQFPAIAGLVPPTPAPVNPAQFADSPAILAAQAASKPFWQMSEQEYQRYKAAGVPDEVIMGVPGRVA